VSVSVFGIGGIRRSSMGRPVRAGCGLGRRGVPGLRAFDFAEFVLKGEFLS